MTEFNTQRLLKIQVAIAILAVGVTILSLYQLGPLSKKQAELRADIEALQAKRAEIQASYNQLKANTESLYSVKVTPSLQVYEVKASAKATGNTLPQGLSEYKFSLFINSPPATLADIDSVTYHMEHETFTQKDYVSRDMKTQFSAGYRGWGCLTNVTVTVKLKSGVTQKLDFNMCKSLGPQWE